MRCPSGKSILESFTSLVIGLRIAYCLSVGASVLLLSPNLMAQAKEMATAPTPEDRAEEAFKQGHLHYERGEYAEAEAAFREAYRLSAVPELLYNLAQAERLGGNCEGALAHYRQYKATSREPLPADLDAKIEQMEACAKQSNPQTPEPPKPPTTPVPEPPLPATPKDNTRRILGWGCAGTAVAAAGLGTFFALRAHAANEEVTEAQKAGAWNSRYAAYETTGVRSQNAAIGLFVTSAVSAVASALLLWPMSTDTDRERTGNIRLDASTDHVAASGTWLF